MASAVLLCSFISILLYCIENAGFLEERSKFNQTREVIVPAKLAKVVACNHGALPSLSTLLYHSCYFSATRTEARAKQDPGPRSCFSDVRACPAPQLSVSPSPKAKPFSVTHRSQDAL